ncbi:hypothetical protein O181_079170 [Austropuccinia psidii MF-1]|uniref:Uncharacterized protein n=1 Tax=Austropuccinia psidii MF-1 TaxID=1389203 RepID=A0A9Q3IHN1_9BASI|nr:hypothetical protein [Austropuccinia psidii MF-1]
MTWPSKKLRLVFFPQVLFKNQLNAVRANPEINNPYADKWEEKLTHFNSKLSYLAGLTDESPQRNSPCEMRKKTLLLGGDTPKTQSFKIFKKLVSLFKSSATAQKAAQSKVNHYADRFVVTPGKSFKHRKGELPEKFWLLSSASSSKTYTKCDTQALVHELSICVDSFSSEMENIETPVEIYLLGCAGTSFIFRAVEYLYRFELITQQQMRGFFENEEASKRAAYAMTSYGGVLRHDLWSKIHYMNPDWLERENSKPSFLATCLASFDNNLQKQFNHWLFVHLFNKLQQNLESEMNTSTFTSIGRYFAISPREFPFLFRLHEEESMIHIHSSLNFFQRQIFENKEVKKEEFLVNLQFLKFLTKYYPDIMRKCFQSNEQYGNFKFKITWAYAALDVNRPVNPEHLEQHTKFIERYAKLHEEASQNEALQPSDSTMLQSLLHHASVLALHNHTPEQILGKGKGVIEFEEAMSY